MTQTTKLVALISLIALLAVAGWNVMAHGGPAALLHGSGSKWHGGDANGHHAMMALWIQSLNLTEDQETQVEDLHDFLLTQHSDARQMHDQHLEVLVERLELGPLNEVEAHAVVDQHLEVLRTRAYEFSDRMVALVNSLDPEQLEKLVSHLEEVRQVHGGGHHH